MSSLFFAKNFCVFVFVVCAFCEAAHSAGAAETVKKINIFGPGLIQKIIPPEGGDANKSIEIESFYSPVLLSTDDVIIAVIGANSNKDSETDIDILTRYIETADDKIKIAFDSSKTIDTNWNTQFALQETDQKEGEIVKSLAAVEQENKIYVLLVNHSEQLKQQDGGGKQWELALIEGDTVKQDQSFQKITWKKKRIVEIITK